MKISKFGMLGVAGIAMFALGIAKGADSNSSQPTTLKAVAELKPAKNSKVKGTVLFVQENAGVHVTAEVTGLTPGEHGFHIHEKGDCSAADFSSAGGHFNPSHKPHGGMESMEHHAGDLGNLTADATGKAHLDFVSHDLSLDGTNSVVGRSVIVHANRDDLVSQPAGNAGPRIACGAIELK